MIWILVVMPVLFVIIYIIKKILCSINHKYVPDHMTAGDDKFYAICKRCGNKDVFPVSHPIMQDWSAAKEYKNTNPLFDWYR